MVCWREPKEKWLGDGRSKLAGTSPLTTPRETTVTRPTSGASFEVFFMSNFNPLSAKLSFQVWYPGGQRLKVISFSWSGVKSLSKCFSNTESTTIIASRDEKRCYAAVEWNQIGALKFVTLRWPTPEVSRMTASLRSPPRCSLTDLQLCVNVQENSEVQNGSDIGSPKQAPKTRWFCKR